MVNFESTERGFIRQQIREVVELPRIGRVVQVYEHIEEDDDSNFEVDVRFRAENVRHRQIPYEGVDGDSVAVPEVGDKVMVEYRRGEKSTAIARNFVYTNEDRPPVGRAGMWRQRFKSGDTPAGSGDLYVTGYTSWDGDSSIDDKDTLNAEETTIQIAKHEADADTVDDAPMKLEVYDSPSNDDAHISIELNAKDGSSTTHTWGLEFDLSDGTLKLVDGDGYGIESDGSGNFTWHHESVDFSEGSTTSL